MIAELRRQMEKALNRRSYLAFGLVTAVDWDRQRCRARLLTSGFESNWLRVGSSWASANEGAVAPLEAGDEVLVAFPGGDPQGMGAVVCRLYGGNRPPASDEQDFGLRRSRGYLVLDAAGNIAARGASVELVAEGALEMSGASFDVEAVGTASVDGAAVSLGGSTFGATRYEPLDAGLQAFAAAVQVQINALLALHALPPVTIPLVITPAMSAKVRVG